MLRTPRTSLRALLTGTVAAAALTTTLIAAPTAQASTNYPDYPSGVRFVAAGTSAVTVAANRGPNTTRYWLYVSTVKADLYVTAIGNSSPTRHSAASYTPQVTVRSLPMTSAEYYWRWANYRNGHLRFSNIGGAYLQPAIPSSVVAHSGSYGVALTWAGGPATGYQVSQATNSTMTQNLRVWTLHGLQDQFTPYGLTQGVTYWFRVRALNGNNSSPQSGVVSARMLTMSTRLRVLTYNLLILTADGKSSNGGVVAPWMSQRRPAAASLALAQRPGVIAVEEGGDFTSTTTWPSPRQVDTFASALGRNWVVANTEILTPNPGYVRTGNYVVYDNSRYAAIGAGGHWYSHGQYVAAYQMLKERATGAQFLMVAAHLHVGMTHDDDLIRQAEMADVVKWARAICQGYRIVYAGDLNSHLSSYHPYDGPGRTAYADRLGEAAFVAPWQSNTGYNSNNLYQRTAPKGLGSIDRVLGEPGVAFVSWSQGLKLDSYGRFVGTIPSDHNPVISEVAINYLTS